MTKRPPKPDPKNWSQDQKQLNELVAKIVHERDGQIEISPMWVATEVMVRLRVGALWRNKPLVYIGCHLHLRQIAREYCREIFEPESEVLQEAQHQMFPGLQKRYPRADARDNYVVLEQMTPEDIAYNVARLRKEAGSKLRHADALEAWGQNRPVASAA